MRGRNGGRGGLWGVGSYEPGMALLRGRRYGAAASRCSTRGRLDLVCMPVVLVYVFLIPVDRLLGDGDVGTWQPTVPMDPDRDAGTWIL